MNCGKGTKEITYQEPTFYDVKAYNFLMVGIISISCWKTHYVYVYEIDEDGGNDLVSSHKTINFSKSKYYYGWFIIFKRILPNSLEEDEERNPVYLFFDSINVKKKMFKLNTPKFKLNIISVAVD